MNKRKRVVITGLGSVTPLGNNTQELWKNLLDGQNGISKISKYDCSEHRCKIAGEVKNFDISHMAAPREIRRIDLFSQYALHASNEAILDSCIQLDQEDLTRIGVNLGCGMGGMTQLETQVKRSQEKGLRRIAPYAIPSAMISAPSAEISIKFGLQGVNFISSAACASSAYAIGLSTRMIQYGEADVIISGGTEAIITPVTMAGFASARALSKRNDEPEKASRPFDLKRDGFVMGEGSGVIVLEELERAQKRGAKIYAEVCGVGWGADACHITSPDPKGLGAIRSMEQAIKDAQINKNQISYINAHGTSTKQNDMIETLAIKNVFGEFASKIPISSTKSMIGHLIGAAAGVESIVCALSIFHNKAHCTKNYEFPDPECDLDYIPGQARDININYAISNSFAFGGSNGSIILGKGPA